MDKRIIGVALLVVLSCALAASADGERPWFRLFGPRGGDKTLPPRPPATDPRRLAEIQVEIAWLADPITFPYFLEARAGAGGVLEVRGYVPSKGVHDHALNIARVYSSLQVVDAVKEHPSLQVRAGQMSPQQLQNAVTTALREALPRQVSNLQVQCGNSGQVVITGTVASHEERLIVSHALRRLYGCTSVQNVTQVPADVAATPGKGPDRAVKVPAAAPRPSETVKPPDTAKSAPPPAPRPNEAGNSSDTAKSAPIQPRIEVQPTAAQRTRPEPAETKQATPPPPASSAVAARLKKKIEETCPGVKGVRIDVVSATELRIEITATTEEQVGPFAEKVLMLPELQDYKGDLQFKVMP